MKTHILIVDDNRKIYESLATNFHHYGMETSHAPDGKSAVRTVLTKTIDVVLLDISIPDMSGIEAISHLLKINPEMKVIALTMHDSKEIITEMIKNGAKGYILKDTPITELITAVHTVYEGEVYYSSKVSKIIYEEYSKNLKGGYKSIYKDNKLSDRETDVLICIVNGLSTKEIADKLFISIRTVETHRYNLKKKLKINSVAGLTKYAIDEGILK